MTDYTRLHPGDLIEVGLPGPVCFRARLRSQTDEELIFSESTYDSEDGKDRLESVRKEVVTSVSILESEFETQPSLVGGVKVGFIVVDGESAWGVFAEESRADEVADFIREQVAFSDPRVRVLCAPIGIPV